MKFNKNSPGFLLLCELLCFSLSIMLLLSAVKSVTRCCYVQQRSLQLEEGWQATQIAAADLAPAAKWRVQRQSLPSEKLQVVEVAVYAADEQPVCTLLQVSL